MSFTAILKIQKQKTTFVTGHYSVTGHMFMEVMDYSFNVLPIYIFKMAGFLIIFLCYTETIVVLIVMQAITNWQYKITVRKSFKAAIPLALCVCSRE